MEIFTLETVQCTLLSGLDILKSLDLAYWKNYIEFSKNIYYYYGRIFALHHTELHQCNRTEEHTDLNTD